MKSLVYLPDDNGDPARSGAARAILSRLYVYQENWNMVATFSHEVINASQYSLAPDFTFYDSDSSEKISRMINTVADHEVKNHYVNLYNYTGNDGRKDAPFVQNLIDVFSEYPEDKRFTELSKDTPDVRNNPSLFTLNILMLYEVHLILQY
ncbi:hypothetical protein GCM10022393_11990 [Aquimarina addita]|uniref:Uncharacterized protein n=1 Tax=Aquimarina addita TaxID=870485 RepID=A0ABP7XFH0_9FLAO